MFFFLTVLQALIGAALVAVILVQKSEGGGLGVGGSPSGFMSARGAADFLTRSTAVLAAIFVALSVVLAALAVKQSSAQKVDTSLVRQQAPAVPAAPADPLAGVAQPAAPAPAANPAVPADPLALPVKK